MSWLGIDDMHVTFVRIRVVGLHRMKTLNYFNFVNLWDFDSATNEIAAGYTKLSLNANQYEIKMSGN